MTKSVSVSVHTADGLAFSWPFPDEETAAREVTRLLILLRGRNRDKYSPQEVRLTFHDCLWDVKA